MLDEPSAGLHPADTQALLTALAKLKAAGDSLFVVEHELEVIREADWIVDVGSQAGEHGGQIIYSGSLAGLEKVNNSATRRHLFETERGPVRKLRQPQKWLSLRGVTRNNLEELEVSIPLGVFTTVTGV